LSLRAFLSSNKFPLSLQSEFKEECPAVSSTLSTYLGGGGGSLAKGVAHPYITAITRKNKMKIDIFINTSILY
jgi:hypothetical protein